MSKKNNTSKNNAVVNQINKGDLGQLAAGLAEVGITSGAVVDAPAFVIDITLGLGELAQKVAELHDSALTDIELHTHYTAIQHQWDDLQAKFRAARVAYDAQVEPLITKLEQDRDVAKGFEKWLTFERSQEIAETIARLRNVKTFEACVPALVMERDGMLPDYKEAQEYFRMNETRKVARAQAGK